MIIDLTGIMAILMFGIFCFLSFWKPNAILFMVLSGMSILFAFASPDILSVNTSTTELDIGICVTMLIFGFLCAAWAFRLMFWKESA